MKTKFTQNRAAIFKYTTKNRFPKVISTAERSRGELCLWRECIRVNCAIDYCRKTVFVDLRL